MRKIDKRTLDRYARETNDYVAWSMGIKLLSLDIIDLFAPELGLEDIPLDCVREVSRQVLVDTGAAWDVDASPPDLTRLFLAAVGDRCGTDVIESLTQWRSEAFPVTPLSSCMRVCRNALSRLVEEWASGAGRLELPIVGMEYVRYRLLMREYVWRHDPLFYESSRLTRLSDWDSKIDEKCGEDYVSDLLFGALYDRLASLWLPLLRKEFPLQEASAFRQWWHTHEYREDCLELVVPA